MYKSNILHKAFALAITLLFAVGQATLIRTQQTSDEVRPELREGKSLKGYVCQLSEVGLTIMDPKMEKEIAIACETAAEIMKSEVWPEVKRTIAFIATSGTPAGFIGVVFFDPENNG